MQAGFQLGGEDIVTGGGLLVGEGTAFAYQIACGGRKRYTISVVGLVTAE